MTASPSSAAEHIDPAGRLAVAEIVSNLANGLAEGQGLGMLRVVAHWYGRLGAEPAAVVKAAIAENPGTCGDQRWDALVAGLCERLARLSGNAVPAWTADPERFLHTWWFLTPYQSLHASAFVGSPPELANRGVFVHASSLESV